MKRIRLIQPGGNYFSSPKKNIKFFSSGSTLLDLALGGGWAESRIANIIGTKSTGKTLLAIEAATNFAKKYPKGKIRYRESEAAFDLDYAKALGMPEDRVDFDVKLDTVEDLFKDLNKIVDKGAHEELYIVDSLDALSDEAEMNRDFTEGSYGTGKAKAMSKMFRMLVSKMSDRKVTLIVISQIRDKIGVTYGKKVARSGGHAMDFYASQVVMLTELGKMTKTYSGIKRPIGIIIKAYVEKNKISLPFREAEFRIRFGYGLDDCESCLDWLALAKHLPDLGIKDVKKHLNEMEAMDNQEYFAEERRIHDVVAKCWYTIETGFLPTRKKN